MLLPALPVTACLYYLIWQTVARELALAEMIAQVLFPALRSVNRIIVIGLPLVFGLTFFCALRLSHRFAGPLDRIEDELETMARRRDFTKHIHLRRKDHLQSLVHKINQAVHAAARPK